MEFKSLRTLSAIALLAGTTVLTGCASTMGIGNPDYSCEAPEMGEQGGVKCMSAREVYKLTERPGPVRFNQVSHQGQAEEVKESKGLGKREEAQPVEVSAPPVADNNHPLALSPISNDPVPIRSRAKIMRVWIAPWEGTNGDLNVSGLVFTELEGRRWNIASQADIEGPSLTPLQNTLSTKVSE